MDNTINYTTTHSSQNKQTIQYSETIEINEIPIQDPLDTSNSLNSKDNKNNINLKEIKGIKELSLQPTSSSSKSNRSSSRSNLMKIIYSDFNGRHKKKNFTLTSHNISNTLDNPNVKLLIKSAATMIYLFIEQDLMSGNSISRDSEDFFFSEEKYMEDFPELFDEERVCLLKLEPSLEDIVEFLENLYDIIGFSKECFVIFLIYINRFRNSSEILVLPLTWRPIVLVSLQLAQKVWDDKSINNETLVQVYPFFTNKAFNIIEQVFIDKINFNTHVKFSQYTKYFLELKSFVLQLEDDIICDENINMIEIKSKLKEDVYKKGFQNNKEGNRNDKEGNRKEKRVYSLKY